MRELESDKEGLLADCQRIVRDHELAVQRDRLELEQGWARELKQAVKSQQDKASAVGQFAALGDQCNQARQAAALSQSENTQLRGCLDDLRKVVLAGQTEQSADI